MSTLEHARNVRSIFNISFLEDPHNTVRIRSELLVLAPVKPNEAGMDDVGVPVRRRSGDETSDVPAQIVI